MTASGQLAYPSLSVDSSAAVTELLVEVVSRYHSNALAEDQLQELRSQIGIQLAAADRLHQFPLTNDREPIFVIQADEGGTA